MGAITNDLNLEIPSAEIIPLQTAVRRPRSDRSLVAESDLADLEFSDYGRDPRFAPAWWLATGWALGLAALSYATFHLMFR
jgi:hypothetical protein